MKALTEKITEECNISKKLRQAAWDANFSQSQEIRKKQQEHWEKFMFWKELNKALEKERKIK